MNNIILNAIGPVVHIIAGFIVPIWFYAVSAGSRVSGADWRVLVFSIFLSLLPDIDTQTSTIGRAFPFIAEPIERRYGHRQITHSLLALLILGLILWLTFPQDWWLLLSAYGSHLIIDTLTGTQGIPLLWPAQLRFYLLRIRPKSTGEVLLGFFCVLALVAPYFTVTHQFIASLTPPEETLVLRPTPTPIPTPTPATFTIKINRVYDIDTEILVHVGDTITHGQKIANLTTHRLLNATPTPTQTPTITPSPLPPISPSPLLPRSPLPT
ncbi:MAG: hypothetical protein GY721_12805, partial [Deltaproteobacteria bacterium]|nr:hypothetical protein [Deltaproteobacteria bacterium]